MSYSVQKFILYLAVVFIYLTVATNFWRGGRSATSTPYLKFHSAMIALGLVIHAWLLYQVIFSNSSSLGLNLGLFNVLSMISWLTVLIYGLTNLKHNLAGLQAFVLPPAAIFALLPASNVANHVIPSAEPPLFLAHIGIALLA